MNKQDVQTIAHSLNLATTVIDSAKQLLNKTSEEVNSSHLNQVIDKQTEEIKELTDKLKFANAVIVNHMAQNERYDKQFHNVCNQRDEAIKNINAMKMQKDNWEETARRYARNEDFYREQRDSYYRELEACKAELAKVRSENNVRETIKKERDYYFNLAQDRLNEISQICTHVSNARNQLDLSGNITHTVEVSKNNERPEDWKPMSTMVDSWVNKD